MDKQKLYEDLVNLAGHVVALYFVMSDPHHLAQLSGNMEIHTWTDYARAGKDDDDNRNLITNLLDDIQEVIAVPVLGDGYIGSKDILARALALTPDIDQNPTKIVEVTSKARDFLNEVGNVLKSFMDTWGEEVRKESGYKAIAFENLLSTWAQYLAQVDGWLIGYKG